MKWALASVGLLVVIVTFSLAALDQKNVVWQAEHAHCPHCRSEVEPYSNTCATCRKAFDWEERETECEHCLSRLDLDWYTARFEAHAEEFRAALTRRPEVAEADVPDFVQYMESWAEGACGFCGGTGKWLAPQSMMVELDAELLPELRQALGDRCPVCFGRGFCIACSGDRRTESGNESAARELDRLEYRLARIDPHRDAASFDRWFNSVQSYVRQHAGREEIRRLQPVCGGRGAQGTPADLRLALIREVLDGLPVED